jgi:hypothetical protein
MRGRALELVTADGGTPPLEKNRRRFEGCRILDRCGKAMILQAVRIENYRSIIQAKSFDIRSFTVLIGPNNEGKSNILRAVNISMQA